MNAKLAELDVTQSSVIDGIHPPVIYTMKAKANNGELAPGLVVAKDGSGDLVAYNPAGVAPVDVAVGVLTQTIDTTRDDAAPVLVHGTVRLSALKVGADAPDADDLAALRALGIYAI